MQIKQFEYVREVAKCNSISKAAQNLFISQQALSETVKLLETELGFQIFERSNKGVRPTKSGEKFLEDLDDIMPTIYGWAQLKESKDKKTVKIFMQHMLGELLSTSELMVLAEEVCDNTIQWETANLKDIFTHLEHDPSSIGLFYLIATDWKQHKLQELQDRGDYLVQPICTNNMMVVLRADDPLANEPYLKPELLLNRTLVHNKNYSMSSNILHILNYTQQDGYYLPQTMDVLHYVLYHPNTFSYLPQIVLKNNPFFESGDIIALHLETDYIRQIYLACHKQNIAKYQELLQALERFFTS